MKALSTLFSVLAVVGAASFAGVMLAIGVILGGYWRSLPPAQFMAWVAQHGDLIVRAIPLVVLPTVVGLAGALWCDWAVPSARWLWLGAAVCIAAVLGFTAVYFIPANAAFASQAIALDQVPSKLSQWLLLHQIRIGLALAASVLGLLAMAR